MNAPAENKLEEEKLEKSEIEPSIPEGKKLKL